MLPENSFPIITLTIKVTQFFAFSSFTLNFSQYTSFLTTIKIIMYLYSFQAIKICRYVNAKFEVFWMILAVFRIQYALSYFATCFWWIITHFLSHILTIEFTHLSFSEATGSIHIYTSFSDAIDTKKGHFFPQLSSYFVLKVLQRLFQGIHSTQICFSFLLPVNWFFPRTTPFPLRICEWTF